ncbi:MAG: gliding motility-associated C-terminal domain-containing protein [Bacteroidetes bacterium]|nr:gliding motility-associated C-terminal domain-containing protein [Bacteroidota bacterium]
MKGVFYRVVLAFLLPFSAFGTHIVGGEITYQYQGSDKYKIRLDLYIDCLNGSSGAIQQDAKAWIAVFDGNTNQFLSQYTNEVNRQGPQRVQKTNYNCLAVAPNACVDHYWYEVTVTLPPRTGGYYISFQRCCRNNTITNLLNPQSTGSNFWTQIPDYRTLPDKKPNSSAVFKELPPNFLCTNTQLKFDHSATDADGDSLAYELFWPYTGGTNTQPRPDNQGNGTLKTPPFVPVSWLNPYTYGNPVDGNPALNIDSKSGFLTLTPTRVGQFVVGIRVKEYRKGILISETKRDYQFNVQACVIDVVASYFAPSIICGYRYQFKNQSQGAQRYKWDFGVAGSTDDTSNITTPTFTFPKAGIYRVWLFAWKNKCVDSFYADLEVLEPLVPKLPKDTTLCQGQSLNLISTVVGDSYRWNTGQTVKAINVTQPGLYWLEVTYRTCKWRDSIQIQVDKGVVDATGDTSYCSNDPFSRKLTATAGMAKYAWSNGSNVQTTVVTSPGVYYIYAETINKCPSSDSVVIKRFLPVTISMNDTTVCKGVSVRFDSRQTAGSVSWSTGDTGRYMSRPDTGLYWVRLQKGLCSSRDSFRLYNYTDELELGPGLRFCDRIDTFLSLAGKPFTNVVWEGEIAGSSFRLTKPGMISVTILNSHGCPESDSIPVLLFPNPGLNLGNDTLVCLAVKPLLDAGPGMISYLWQNGTTEQTIRATDTGLYWVEIKDQEGCRSRDSIRIEKRGDLFPPILFMPTAFTPDGNGRNDLYPMNKYVNIGTLYNVKLYNRWGEKLAELQSPDVNWDGTINGRPAEEGVYVFLATWIGCDDQRHTVSGNFTLLR